ncbi:MAG: MMPL family transporter, partial [Limnobacter sp.]|nr:MMPL family transporter [Limnobacter sp.]
MNQPLKSTSTQNAPWIEKIIFEQRNWVLLFMAVLTAILAWQASQLKVAASFEKMIPTGHPYVQNFLDNKKDLSGLGNVVRITVQAKQGDIFSKDYLETLKQVTDKAFFIPGVSRPDLRSLWTSNVRWVSVTEEGLEGGQVIPASYDGDEESIQQVKQNVELSGQIGRLVANDFESTIVYVPLLEVNPQTGERIDYQALSEQMETEIRDEFNSDSIQIRITGFAKIVGDLIDGATQVVMFFGIAVLITFVMLLLYSRSFKSTLTTLSCSIVAVIWQLGIINALGKGLDPYSMLVPFLIFAIAVSHGVQIVNAIAAHQAKGQNSYWAARFAFRGLYVAGLTAL